MPDDSRPLGQVSLDMHKAKVRTWKNARVNQTIQKTAVFLAIFAFCRFLKFFRDFSSVYLPLLILINCFYLTPFDWPSSIPSKSSGIVHSAALCYNASSSTSRTKANSKMKIFKAGGKINCQRRVPEEQL